MAKGKKTGGRIKGTPNKISVGVKVALETAFDEIGGVKALTEWGKANKNEFYSIWAKMLPKNVELSGEVQGRLIIVRAA